MEWWGCAEVVSATATRLTTSNAVPTRPSWLNAAANSSAEASWPADTVADQLADPWSHWKSRAGKEEEAVAGTLADYSHAATPCGHQSHSDRPFALSAVDGRVPVAPCPCEPVDAAGARTGSVAVPLSSTVSSSERVAEPDIPARASLQLWDSRRALAHLLPPDEGGP